MTESPAPIPDFTQQGPNGNVVGFHPALSAAAACNNAIMFLGNVVAAKSALMYVVKYIAKDRANLTNILSVFVSAHDHIQRHPSVAADTGTEIRTAQHSTG
jgi:hypothetical protein